MAHGRLRGIRATLPALACFAWLALDAGGADAQADGDGAAALEAVIVTASKRESILQDTSMTVSVLDEEALSSMHADDFADYAGRIPGFGLVDNGPGSRRLVIRGIQGAGEAQVGLYFDEMPVTGAPGATNNAGARQPDIKLFDIDRIEVLRGPQGTLYGAGSVGGTLRVITNKPDSTEFATSVRGSFFAIDHGGAGTGLNGMVNVPLVDDKLAARAVFYSRNADGYIDNISWNERNVNDEDTTGGRIALRWTPNSSLALTGTYIRQDMQSDAGYHFTSRAGDLLSDIRTRDPIIDNFEALNLLAEWDIEEGSLVASYTSFSRDLTFTFDGSDLFAAPWDRLSARQPQPLDLKSAEIRFSSAEGRRRIGYTAGLFTSVRDADLDGTVYTAGSDGRIDPDSVFFSRVATNELRQDAVFGELSFAWTDDLTITGGLRLFDTELKNVNTALVDFFGVPVPNPTPILSRSTEHGLTYRLNVSYELRDATLIYGQIGEGFRPGGANQTVVGQPIPAGFDSDTVTNYEFGWRTGWRGNSINLNGAVYHILWDRIQVENSTPDNLFRFTDNAGEATVDGIELELDAALSRNLELSAAINFTDAKLTENQPPTSPFAGLSGDKIPVVPDDGAFVGIAYSRPLNNGMQLSLSGFLTRVGKSNNNFRDFLVDADPSSPTFGQETTVPNDRFATMDAYTTIDLGLGVKRGNWGAEAYIKNASDERGETFIFVDNFRPSPGYTYVIQPRTVGVSFNYSH